MGQCISISPCVWQLHSLGSAHRVDFFYKHTHNFHTTLSSKIPFRHMLACALTDGYINFHHRESFIFAVESAHRGQRGLCARKKSKRLKRLQSHFKGTRRWSMWKGWNESSIWISSRIHFRSAQVYFNYENHSLVTIFYSCVLCFREHVYFWRFSVNFSGVKF
jgi:hypothetical protein